MLSMDIINCNYIDIRSDQQVTQIFPLVDYLKLQLHILHLGDHIIYVLLLLHLQNH